MNTYHRKSEALWTHRHISYIANKEEHFWNIEFIIKNFENDYSRFKNDSVINKVNTTKKIMATQELSELVNIWLEYYKKTEWFFSMFIWSVLTNLWYDADYSFIVKDKKELPGDCITMNDWEIILSKNTTLDFWWFGKGYLIDKIGNYFTQNGIQNRIINGWWDILINQEKSSYFGNIWLQHSSKKEMLIWEIQILKWSITCSSVHERKRWKNHHLIDPKTWKSVLTDIANIYVYSKSACKADIASTTLYVCWKENLASYAKKLWVKYIVIFNDSTFIHSKDFPGLVVYT